MPSPFSSSSSITTSSSPSSISLSPMDRRIEVLHLDVPLISTRRASSANKWNEADANHSYSTETSRSVPFVWERSPGVPKEHMIRSSDVLEVFTPRPPPGRWRPPSNLNESANDGDNDEDATSSASETDMFSDALDRMSLSESLGMPCRLSVSKDTGPGMSRAPSFIMDRFLPAANALAASSAAALPKHPLRRARYGPKDSAKLRPSHLAFADATNTRAGYAHGQYGDTRPASPTKACGIMLLFPWSMKGAICGLKSPIRCQTPKMATLVDYTGRRCRRGGGDDYGLGSDDGLSSKAWKSPGWGLPFLDASRLRRKVERESPKGKDKGVGLRPASGRPLPRLKSPSEPWLANALNSVNRSRY